MSYGQTGSGKTFTMLGSQTTFKHRGIIPRAMGEVFSEIDSRSESEIIVHLSYIEIYNEKIYDLLADTQLEGKARGSRFEGNSRYSKEHVLSLDLPACVAMSSTYMLSLSPSLWL